MGKLSSKHQVVPFSENSYYIGPTNNQDELDGNGKFVDEFGNCYVGHFKNNNFNGYGTMKYNQASYINEMRVLPIQYEGYWKDNNKHGKGTIHYTDDSKYVGEFKFDELHGKCKYIFSDGMYYVGNMKLGNITGYGSLYTADKKLVYKGYWLDNLYNGKGSYYEDGNIYYNGKWSAGCCHGVGVIYDDRGKKCYKAIFNKGKIDKVLQKYYYIKPTIKYSNNKIMEIPTIKSKPGTHTVVNPAHNLSIVQRHKISTPKTIKLNSSDFKKVNNNKVLFTKVNPRSLKRAYKIPPIISVNPYFNK